MPSTTLPAAAEGLPTRRLALTSLAGFGAALALPKIAKAATAPPSPDAALLARAAEVDAANARCAAAYKRHSAAERLKFAREPSPDYDASDAEVEAAEDAWSALRGDLVDMPARTVAGLKLKVRACGGDPELDPGMMASIAADILAMDGGAL